MWYAIFLVVVEISSPQLCLRDAISNFQNIAQNLARGYKDGWKGWMPKLTEEHLNWLCESIPDDKAYDSDRLDSAMAVEGIEMIARTEPIACQRTSPQDGRTLRRYKRRGPLNAPLPGSSTTGACAFGGKGRPSEGPPLEEILCAAA